MEYTYDSPSGGSVAEDACRTPIVQQGSTWFWHYASDRPPIWPPTILPNGWPSGPSPLGYDGDSEIATPLPWGQNEMEKYLSAYFVREIDLPHEAEVRLRVRGDDGYVLYVNGAEAWRENLPPTGPILNDTKAVSSLSGPQEGMPSSFLSVKEGTLRAGSNIIAVEVHQSDGASSDLIFDMEVCRED